MNDLGTDIERIERQLKSRHVNEILKERMRVNLDEFVKLRENLPMTKVKEVTN